MSLPNLSNAALRPELLYKSVDTHSSVAVSQGSIVFILIVTL